MSNLGENEVDDRHDGEEEEAACLPPPPPPPLPETATSALLFILTASTASVKGSSWITERVEVLKRERRRGDRAGWSPEREFF